MLGLAVSHGEIRDVGEMAELTATTRRAGRMWMALIDSYRLSAAHGGGTRDDQKRQWAPKRTRTRYVKRKRDRGRQGRQSPGGGAWAEAGSFRFRHPRLGTAHPDSAFSPHTLTYLPSTSQPRCCPPSNFPDSKLE